MQTGSILIVDDDPAIRATVGEILEFEGYNVVQASNGAEALRALERTDPALILLDMRMPVLDGWDFAGIMQRRSVPPPIVVMTAAQNARLWSQEIDAVGYLAKPFDLVELLSAVDYAIHRTA